MTNHRNRKDTEGTEELIRRYEECYDFTHTKVTDEMIKDAETELHVHLPESYVRFLKKYGQGGFLVFAVLGYRKDGAPVFVDATEDYRINFELPVDLVVIEEVNQGIYCIQQKNGKIVFWDTDTGSVKPAYDNFSEYLKARILETVSDPSFAIEREKQKLRYLDSIKNEA